MIEEPTMPTGEAPPEQKKGLKGVVVHRLVRTELTSPAGGKAIQWSLRITNNFKLGWGWVTVWTPELVPVCMRRAHGCDFLSWQICLWRLRLGAARRRPNEKSAATGSERNDHE